MWKWKHAIVYCSSHVRRTKIQRSARISWTKSCRGRFRHPTWTYHMRQCNHNIIIFVQFCPIEGLRYKGRCIYCIKAAIISRAKVSIKIGLTIWFAFDSVDFGVVDFLIDTEEEPSTSTGALSNTTSPKLTLYALHHTDSHLMLDDFRPEICFL